MVELEDPSWLGLGPDRDSRDAVDSVLAKWNPMDTGWIDFCRGDF